MLECNFVVFIFFIARTIADVEKTAVVPLKQFKNVEYVLTDADKTNNIIVMKAFGLTDEDIKMIKNAKEKSPFILNTPEKQGGEYTLTFTAEDDSEIVKKFKLNDPKTYGVTNMEVTVTYTVEGDKLVVKSVSGEKTMIVTVKFSADQVLETYKFGEFESTRRYTLKSMAAGDVATIADGQKTAKVPLKHFNNVEYVLTDADKMNNIIVMKAFGLTDEDIKTIKNAKEKSPFILNTPEEQGGEYTLTFTAEDDSEIVEKFKLNDPKTYGVTNMEVTVTYTVEGNTLIVTSVSGEKTMIVTVKFSADQVLETYKFGDFESIRRYTLKSAAAAVGDTETTADGETTAEVPLKQFKNIEYVLTDADKVNNNIVMKAFGLTDEDIKMIKNAKEKSPFILNTPEKQGGEYTLTFTAEDDSEIVERFKLNDPKTYSTTNMEVTVTYTVEGDKLVVTSVSGEKTMIVTVEFSADQVIETYKLSVESTRRYTRSAAAGDAAKPAERSATAWNAKAKL